MSTTMRKYMFVALELVCVESMKITRKKAVTKKSSDDTRITNNWELSGLHEGDLIKDEKRTLKTWPGAVVPYRISDKISKYEQDTIRGAMDEIQEKSCVRFRPYKKGDVNYIYINRDKPGCWPYTGFKGGEQPLYANKSCMRHGVLLHLLVHAIGYISHLYNLPNRDDYIKVHWENIDKKYYWLFEKENDVTDFGLPYDYQSIMHYHPYAYSKNKKPTMTPLKKGAEIGHNNKLSKIDAKMINLMYNCSKVKPCVTTTTKASTLPNTKEIVPCGSKIYVFW